jgi:hypothetical protein
VEQVESGWQKHLFLWKSFEDQQRVSHVDILGLSAAEMLRECWGCEGGVISAEPEVGLAGGWFQM